jgi:hypothetical protein
MLVCSSLISYQRRLVLVHLLDLVYAPEHETRTLSLPALGNLRLHDPPRLSENATGRRLLEELRASDHVAEHDRVVNLSIQVTF